MPHPSAKGKGRLFPRAEGPGGAAGVVLPLDMIASSAYDIAYTIPVQVGAAQQALSLQVDTGSSDLWIASTACASAACGQTGGRLYNPASATDTGQPFAINYLEGNVSGPIVWDALTIGGYSILNQALAAADTVVSEPLSAQFSGILGLALPLNSVIAQKIPPVTSNSPDGAPFASNLFGITPASAAPAAPFLSLALARPGSDTVPSLLGIGRHPAQLVPDPGLVAYATLVTERPGILFWKANVRAITVYVAGAAMPVAIGRSNTGAVFPTAVLDSGVPLILTTSAVANGIYGALGIGPASDGQYYVPCNTPLNLTVTLDNRPPVSVHPLDLTTPPPADPASAFCIGLIQAADAQLGTPLAGIGDMVLGVPFLRNVYTVMAYQPPDAAGAFGTNASAAGGDADEDAEIRPRLGLLGLTDPTTALAEFTKVRVLNEPLSTGTPGAAPAPAADAGPHHLAVGVEVLLGLLAFFALAAALFAARWALYRRRFRARAPGGGARDHKRGVLGAYRRARRGSVGGGEGGGAEGGAGAPSEDALRAARFAAYMRKERVLSEHTVSTGRTRVGEEGDKDDAWDPQTALEWGKGGGGGAAGADTAREGEEGGEGEGEGPETARASAASHDSHDAGALRVHARTASEAQPVPGDGGAGAAVPLLRGPPDAPPPAEEDGDGDDLAEFGVRGGGMAGVGTAARGSRIGAGLRRDSQLSVTVVGGSEGGEGRPRSVRSPSGPRPASGVGLAS